MLRGIGDMLEAIHLLLPPWAVAGLLTLLLVAAIPAWLNNVRTKQIRGIIRRMVRASEPERQQLAERALQLAASKTSRLISVVEQAHKYDQRSLQEQALSALDALDPAEAARLRFGMQPDAQKKVRHPLELAVRAERLLDEGLVEAASETLAPALQRSPEDPDLLDLQARIDATRRAASEAASSS